MTELSSEHFPVSCRFEPQLGKCGVQFGRPHASHSNIALTISASESPEMVTYQGPKQATISAVRQPRQHPRAALLHHTPRSTPLAAMVAPPDGSTSNLTDQAGDQTSLVRPVTSPGKFKPDFGGTGPGVTCEQDYQDRA